MRPFRFFPLAVVLASCTLPIHPMPKAPSKVPAAPPGKEVPLTELDADFLFLAAEDAIQRRQDELAIRFLRALMAKDKTAVLPRLQLAELLLGRRKHAEALEHIRALLAGGNLDSARRRQVRLLKAQALAAGGARDQALEELQRLLREAPGLLQARLLQVRLYMEQGEIANAEAAVREGLKHGEQPALYRLQSELLLRQGKLEQAEAALRAMQRLAPDDDAPVLLLSDLALRRKDAAKAEAVLREFRRRHPRALRVGNALGRLLVKQNRLQEAARVYEDLIRRLGRDHAEILTTLGLLYYQLEDYDRAVERFRRALARQPDNASLRFYLAASLDGAGRRDEAERLYGRIDINDPGYIEAQMRLAGMEADRGRLQRAGRRLLALIRQHPKLANAYAMLSAVRLKQKRYAQLLKETEPALALASVPGQLLFNRAVACEELGDLAGIEANLRRLLAKEPDNGEALNFLGYALAERGIRLDEAEALIRKALKKQPQDGYYLDSLAWVYYQRGDAATALKLQRKALTQVEDDAVMQEHLGDILWRLGRRQEARAAWRRALQLKHEHPQRLRRKIRHGP